jgi:CHAT domain
VRRSPEHEEELFRRAVAAYEAGDRETAKELFQQVVAISGKHRQEAVRYLRYLELGLDSYRPRGDDGRDPPSGGISIPPAEPVIQQSEPPKRGGDEDWPVFLFPILRARPPAFDAPSVAPEPVVTAPQPLRRIPHMDLFPASPVAPGTRLKVSVYTDAEALRPGESGDDVVLEGPAEQNRFDVQAWLVVGGPFAIEGPAVQPLTILRDQEKSEAAEFTVIRGAGADEGTATFSAYFAYEGRACGKVSRAVPLAAGASAPDADEPPAVRIEPGARPADLTIRIVARDDDDCAFECHVQTPLLPQYADGATGPWRLKSLAADLVGRQMERFTAPDAADKVRTLALRGAGIQLFEASPKLFQKAFWELIDTGKPPSTIAIVTEEPYIPWELMVPTRTGPDGEDEQRDPLGVEFRIGRWTSREHIAAPQRIALRDSWVVAPRDSQLKDAEEEAGMVLREIPGERIDPACVEGLEQAFTRQGRTLLHFVCHGKSGAAGGQALEMENEEELDASYLRALPAGPKKSFRAGKPFVFLNACEVGREEPALVGVGGFAEQFMILGASGVIAPLWSVKDSIAHRVAVEFYDRIKKEPQTPFAEILRDLRKRSYADEGGEDTWAAYCFYGDPLAARQ